MSRGWRSQGAVLAGIVAIGLLVWASTAGPEAFVGPSGRRRAPRSLPTLTTAPTGSATASSRLQDQKVASPLDLQWLGDLLLYSLILALALLVGWLLLILWRRRPPRLPEALDVDFVEIPEGVRVSRRLGGDRSRQLAVLDEGTPRNGIVQCWNRLEEIIAEAGLPRRDWETSAEFTVRVLHSLDLDPHAIGELARLYREARFSEHDLGEPQRAAAREALDSLHRDLAARRPVGT